MTRKRGRLSRRDAERTLSDPAGSDSALGTALSAAAGPARPDELRGEDAALAAFQAARLAPPPATRDHYVSPTRLAGRATTRLIVATGAVLALGSGGLAVAMGAQLDDIASFVTGGGRPAADRSASPSDTPSDSPSDSPTDSPTDASTSDAPSTSPTPGGHGDRGGKGDGKGDGKGEDRGDGSPSSQPDPQADRVLERACRDALYPGLERGHDDNLDLLVEQAGGADQVEAFCLDLLGQKPVTPGKPAKPSKPDKPAKPSKPDNPDKPAKPSKPDKPAKPSKPDKPAKPSKPEQAGKPDKPDHTGKPDKPGKPATPEQAGKPGQGGPQKNHSRSGGQMTPG